MFICFKMFNVFLKVTLVCFVVVLLTVQINFAWEVAPVNVEEKELLESSLKNSLTTMKVQENQQQQISITKEKENEDHKDSAHSDGIKNKTKAGNDSLEENKTEEPFLTEPMTALITANVHADETTPANMKNKEENKGRSKRSKMMIGEVSEEEREYIKLELRRLTGLVEFLQERQHSPVLDPALDQLRTALDELMGDADELKSRQQGY